MNRYEGKSITANITPGVENRFWVHAVDGQGRASDRSDFYNFRCGTASPSPSPIAVVPSNFNHQCISSGTQARISWQSLVSRFNLRMDGQGASYPSQRDCDPHEVCINNYNSTSILVNVTPGEENRFWAHPLTSQGQEGERSVTYKFRCSVDILSSPTPSASPSPTSSPPATGLVISRVAIDNNGTQQDLDITGNTQSVFNLASSSDPNQLFNLIVSIFYQDSTFLNRPIRFSYRPGSTEFRAPRSLSFSCLNNGTRVRLDWERISLATTYSARIDNLSDSWNGSCSSPGGDACLDNLRTNSVEKDITPGADYQYWVHTNRDSGQRSDASEHKRFLCSPFQKVQANCLGNSQVRLAWPLQANVRGYALRIDNTDDRWDGSCTSPSGDACREVAESTYTFSIRPNSRYEVWYHGIGANRNFSLLSEKAEFSCPN